MEKLLSDIYYSPGKFTNAKNLQELANEKDPSITYKQVKDWLDKQTIHQLTKRNINDKRTHHGHFYVTKPNAVHQMDLLYMPHYKYGYKYILTVIDTASRYKAGQPLKNKTSADVVKALEKIYDTTKLKYPERVNIDKGSEFKKDVLDFFKKHDVKVNVSDTAFHKATAMVERFNKTLAERLFKQIHHKEITTNKVIKKWDDILQPTIDQLNNEVTSYIKMKPIDAIELDYVKQKDHKDIIPIEDEFEVGDKVRYKLANDKIHDISSSSFVNGEVVDLKVKHGKRRATDPSYSIKIHTIESIKEKHGMQPLYYLNGIKHGFVQSNLMKIEE